MEAIFKKGNQWSPGVEDRMNRWDIEDSVLFVLRDRVLLLSLGRPKTHYID